MSEDNGFGNIFSEELVKSKIPAFSGVKAENNRLVLGYLAMNGASFPYRIFKDLHEEGHYKDWQYPTVYRRVKDLVKKRYLAEAGKKRISRGKQTVETQYALTWRGFIASLSIEEIRKNILQVLDKNSLLNIPAKDLVLSVFENIFGPKELEKLTVSLFHDFLMNAPSLERIEEGELMFRLFICVMKLTSPNLEKFMKNEGLLRLLDEPKILYYVQKKIQPLKADFEKQLIVLTQAVEILNAIESVKQGEKPSEKLKEFFNSRLTEGE